MSDSYQPNTVASRTVDTASFGAQHGPGGIPRLPALFNHQVISPMSFNGQSFPLIARSHGHSHTTAAVGHTHGHGHVVAGHPYGHALSNQAGLSAVNMQLRLPLPVTPPSVNAQPLVIDIENTSNRNGSSGTDGGGGGGSSNSGGGLGAAFLRQASSGPSSNEDGNNQDQTQLGSISSVKELVKSLEGTLPFVILVFAKIMYDHRLGILVFVAMYGTFFHANSSLRKLIMQRDVHNSMDYMGNLVWIIGFLAANIFFIYYVFDEEKLYGSLYFVCPDLGEMNLWNLLWVVGVTDFVIKYSTVLLKALITALPRQVLPFRKKGRFYLLVEVLSRFYRSLVPIVPWLYFLQESGHGGQWFSIVLLVLYIICKGADIFGRFKELKKGFEKFKMDTNYGSTPSPNQLESDDNSCPMCLDQFQDPIVLSCRHIFCEECISKWLNQESTCPLCRANIISHPQWRDGSTSGNIQLW